MLKNNENEATMKKNQENEENGELSEDFQGFLLSHAKSSTFSRVFAVVDFNFCSTKSCTISMNVFGLCLFLEKINKQFWVSPFSDENCKMVLDVKQKHTFYRL